MNLIVIPVCIDVLFVCLSSSAPDQKQQFRER